MYFFFHGTVSKNMQSNQKVIQTEFNIMEGRGGRGRAEEGRSKARGAGRERGRRERRMG